MEAQLNSVALLQWYVDMGADEAIGDAPIDRTRIVEKPAATILPMMPAVPAAAAAPVAAPAPGIGAIEALGDAKELAAKANTLDELRTALDNFKGLPLKRTATQMIFADGNPAAKVMLVGDAPGADEDRGGKPFMGANGQLLDKMLASIGLNREEHVYITNVVNWHPPGNRPLSETELALSLPFVQRHIELVNPSVLIYVGGVPAKALMQTKQAITALRGKWIDYSSERLEKPISSMALFHPTYLLASPSQKSLAWADLLMLKTKLKELGVIQA